MVWIGSFLFEVLDYGADISGGVEVGSGFSRRFYVIYAANFINLVVRNLFGVCKELQVRFSQVFCSWGQSSWRWLWGGCLRLIVFICLWFTAIFILGWF
jgi:hypothetical protein